MRHMLADGEEGGGPADLLPRLSDFSLIQTQRRRDGETKRDGGEGWNGKKDPPRKRLCPSADESIYDCGSGIIRIV